MKRILSFVLLAILCLSTFTSCNGGETSNFYTSYVLDGLLFERSSEDVVWNSVKLSDRYDPSEKLQKEINGTVYNAEMSAIYTAYNGYAKAVEYIDPDKKVIFLLADENDVFSPDNARVIRFETYSDINKFEESSKTSEIPITKIAIDFAGKHISDLSAYELESTPVPVALGTNSGNYATKYTFRKTINGYSTTDYLSITVTYGGTIEEFSIGQIGEFDELEKTVDFEKVEKSVEKELEYECYKLDVDTNSVLPLRSCIIKRYDERIVLMQTYYIVVNEPDKDFSKKPITIFTPLDFEPFEINIEK